VDPVGGKPTQMKLKIEAIKLKKSKQNNNILHHTEFMS
jgi:hypothetical protein